MIVRRAAAGLAVAAAAIMLLAPASASANPMLPWSVASGVIAPVKVHSADRPMLPWGGHEHGPMAPDGVTIDSANGQ